MAISCAHVPSGRSNKASPPLNSSYFQYINPGHWANIYHDRTWLLNSPVSSARSQASRNRNDLEVERHLDKNHRPCRCQAKKPFVLPIPHNNHCCRGNGISSVTLLVKLNFHLKILSILYPPPIQTSSHFTPARKWNSTGGLH